MEFRLFLLAICGMIRKAMARLQYAHDEGERKMDFGLHLG